MLFEYLNTSCEFFERADLIEVKSFYSRMHYSCNHRCYGFEYRSFNLTEAPRQKIVTTE